MTNNMNARITSDNLKVLKDQIEYEALMNKKPANMENIVLIPTLRVSAIGLRIFISKTLQP